MKKIALFVLLGLLAASCSDDDPSVFEKELIGTWHAAKIINFPYPADMPEYIRFDKSTYYSSDTELSPSSNPKAYEVKFSKELGDYVLNISGDTKEYSVKFGKDPSDNILLLDLSYLVTPADSVAGTEEVRQSLPYKKAQ